MNSIAVKVLWIILVLSVLGCNFSRDYKEINHFYSIDGIPGSDDYTLCYNDDGYLIGITPKTLNKAWLYDDTLISKVVKNGSITEWYIININEPYSSKKPLKPILRSKISKILPQFDEFSKPFWKLD